MDAVMKPNQLVFVWDGVVRLFHWATVLLCMLNFFVVKEGGRYHRYIGYTLAGLLLIRIIWGFVGGHYARFGQWWPTPTRVKSYLAALKRGEHPYYLGHNPGGSLMILIMLVGLIGTVVTGLMTRYESIFGDDLLEEIHGLFANGLQFAILIHVLAVVFTDLLTKGDLIRAMVTGCKRVPEETLCQDVKPDAPSKANIDNSNK